MRAAEDPDATAYAILTGVTAGVGLGMNCAMIFEPDPHDPDVLVGRAAVGPHDRAEADRVWRAIEAEQPSLETLYEAGLRRHGRDAAGDRGHVLRRRGRDSAGARRRRHLVARGGRRAPPGETPGSRSRRALRRDGRFRASRRMISTASGTRASETLDSPRATAKVARLRRCGVRSLRRSCLTRPRAEASSPLPETPYPDRLRPATRVQIGICHLSSVGRAAVS